MRARTLILASLVAATTPGCFLQDNPAFIDSGTGSGTGTSGTGGADATMGSGPTSGPATSNGTSTSGPTSGPTGGSDETTGTGGIERGPGCNDPSVCRTIHIGPLPTACPHQVDGVDTDECDEVGVFALRIAAETLEYYGEGGLIVMHDNAGVATDYVGSVELFADTTVRAAPDTPPENINVFHYGADGTFRLRGDSVHLQGFTLVCRAGCENAFRMRADPATEGSETGGHLIEQLDVFAVRPENVGANSIVPIFQSVGPDSVIRNNHFRGYFEDPIDVRFAANTVFSHNTFVWYQNATGNGIFDATQVDGLEISNNVFVALTHEETHIASVDAGTDGFVMVGNVIEGFATEIAGLEPTDPSLTLADNTLGPVQAESPIAPRMLSDAPHVASAMGVSTGTSLDGVDLASATDVVPGAFQVRSTLAVPRRTTITVGDAMCAGSPCTITKGIDNELQRAVWSTWPGGTVEIYPSPTPYNGLSNIGWPITIRGMGAQPEEVVLERAYEDTFLDDNGMWDATPAVVTLTGHMLVPSVVENLTIRTDSNDVGLFHEGNPSDPAISPHEIRRVRFEDDGTLGTDPSGPAMILGTDVVAHDILVDGGFHACVRFGPRPYSDSTTPSTTGWVHHITCRLTLPEDGAVPIAAFEVASVTDAIIADAVVEMVEPGPLFRAQRRSTGDTDPLVAVDQPASFLAQAISVRGHGADFDGFTALDGSYSLVDIVVIGIMEPLFVSAVDSHLDPLATPIDTGVDPAALLPALGLGVTMDGIDRAGHVPDRGAYEQGL